MSVYVVIAIIFVLVILTINYLTRDKLVTQDINNINWSRNKCNYIVNSTLENVLKDNNIKEVKDNKSAQLYMPCTYDDIDKEIEQIQPQNKDQKFFIISGTDLITAKEQLAKHIIDHHGLEKAKTMMPLTYNLTDPNDIENLKKDYVANKNKLYIMKKNIQRQEGLQITNSLPVLLDGSKLGYVVAQELLQDPYIINKRKTNMRFYVLVVCQNKNLNVYVFNNGFMYYTKNDFVKNSLNADNNITTGYIDRSVYETNPLTHDDFRKYLDDPARQLSDEEKNLRAAGFKLSDIVFKRINNLLRDVFVSYIGKICMNSKMQNYKSFQIFGADVAVDDKLMPKIMEVNKGPDLGAKDKRDGDVKYACTRDALKVVGVIKNEGEKASGFLDLFSFVDAILI